mgnify:CR=1 FL=1
MSIFRGFLLHICVICSFACIIAKILDWYNPFMDFSGHMAYIQIILYLAVPIMVLTKSKGNTKKQIMCKRNS